MDHDVQNGIGQLLAAAIPLLTTIVGYLAWYAGEWFKAHKKAVEAKLGAEKWNLLENYAQLAVKTAEQLGLTGVILNEGAEKKEWALNAIQQWLDGRGIPASATDLDVLIEGAIRDGVHKSWADQASMLTTVSAGTVTVATNDATTQTISSS